MCRWRSGPRISRKDAKAQSSKEETSSERFSSLCCFAPLRLCVSLGRRIAMLDVHFIRDNLEAVKANVRNRGVKADPERAVRLDDERKRLVQEAQAKQQR